MRIQQMRSGFLHLKKKVETTDPKNIFEMRSIFDDDLLPEVSLPDPAGSEAVSSTGTQTDLSALCELDQKQWAVVSFDAIEGGPLTYADAVSLMEQLDLQRVPGLCIVTADAAHRMD